MTRNFVRAATTIAAILLAACGGKGKKSVSEDSVPVIYKEDIQMMPADSVIDLSRYTESWDTVFLEATDQSLVGNIDKVFCYDGLENPVLLLYHINKEHFLPFGSTAENSGKSPFKMPLQPNKLLPSP